MPDPLITVAMVLVAALVEWSPRRLVPIGAVLAAGVVLGTGHNGGIGVMALAGAVGVTLASAVAALEARRGRDRTAAASTFARAQRDAMHARLSSSRAFARVTFVMAALPGPTGKLLYPLLGAMRAPLLPALVGTIIGRTITLSITTTIFVFLARAASVDDSGAASFLITAIILLAMWRLIGSVDWAHRSATGQWRLRDVGNDPFGARMFMGGMPGAGGPGQPAPGTPADPRQPADDDVLEGDVVGEEIIDDEDQPSGADASSSSRTGELPSGS